MRPADPARVRPSGPAYLEELRALGEAAGLDRIGVAPATVLARARSILVERRAAGLHDTMQFTYRNPERSTDPGAAVAGARLGPACLLQETPASTGLSRIAGPPLGSVDPA